MQRIPLDLVIDNKGETRGTSGFGGLWNYAKLTRKCLWVAGWGEAKWEDRQKRV